MNNLKEFEKQLLEFRNQKVIWHSDQKILEKKVNNLKVEKETYESKLQVNNI
jgi:hypothetical protein